MVHIGKTSPPIRSSGALKRRRHPLSWPRNRDFRILSIDGGGIRGILPAAFLAGLEERYLDGSSVARYFDLIAGTSTGGIIALGLAAGLNAAELRDLYIQRGHEIFPPRRGGFVDTVWQPLRKIRGCFKYRYDRAALMRVVDETLGGWRLSEARSRLCIPSFDGRYGEVYIFKTPHHPDFRKDGRELMTKVAAATAAAPTFFRPLEDGGYTFVDGGVWANNPIMIALVDVLSCFTVERERVKILSLGCGDKPYVVDKPKILRGGQWAWRDIMYAAMRLQSANALGQAGLLIGADRIVRVDAPPSLSVIEIDDWVRSVAKLPAAANIALDEIGETVTSLFLESPAATYRPTAGESTDAQQK